MTGWLGFASQPLQPISFRFSERPCASKNKEHDKRGYLINDLHIDMPTSVCMPVFIHRYTHVNIHRERHVHTPQPKKKFFKFWKYGNSCTTLGIYLMPVDNN